MHTTEICEPINSFWDTQEPSLTYSEWKSIEEWLDANELEQYVAPSVHNPVPAKKFVCWLRTDFMESFLKEAYPRYDMIKERMPPRVRFLAYFCLNRTVSLKKAYRSLEPQDFYRMGFEEVPNYELLRVFVYEKITRERLKDVFSLIIAELGQVLKSYKVKLGVRVGEDATDVRALKHDKEADYSGYYKEYGYKLDIVHDLDQETLPLDYSVLKINDDEGKCLLESHKRLQRVGFRPREWKIDGKYPTYENIAHTELQYTHLVYKIQEHWVYNEKGSVDEIKRRYQHYHDRSDFQVTNELEEMLAYLLKMDDTEWVGAYFRNQAMECYSDDPDQYLSACNERSGKTEGMMGIAKTETALDKRLPCRGWNAFQFTANVSMLAFAFAALIRAQNGDQYRLGNLTYIT